MKIFIPIKKNSQRVPRKNFRILDGEPLYKFQLLKFNKFDIFVDTDSEEIYSDIKKDNRLKNVEVFYRKKELTGDKTSVCDLIKGFIISYDINEPIAQIHVTSPFLRQETLLDGFSYIKHGFDSIVSCNKLQTRLWRKESYGYCPVNHNPLKLEQTQDLPEVYEENSAFYIFDSKIISITGNRIGKNPYFYEIKQPESLDIDTEEDWNKVLERIKYEKY